jgi:branched-chain amino acid aminotransferase
VRTNDRSADVLEGITRASVLDLCADIGIPVEIGPIELDDLYAADEVFFTGTAVEVTPINAIDDRAFLPERPIATRIRTAFRKAVVGEDRRHADWITWVGTTADEDERASHVA